MFDFNDFWQAALSRLVLRILERCRSVAMRQIIEPTLRPLICSFFETNSYEPEDWYAYLYSLRNKLMASELSIDDEKILADEFVVSNVAIAISIFLLDKDPNGIITNVIGPGKIF